MLRDDAVLLKPYPHQIEGAVFLADRQYALLADEPRVGKTGAAIMAADLCCDEKILVVTTASGRAVWRRAFAQWSAFDRKVEILAGPRDLDKSTNVAITGWSQLTSGAVQSFAKRRQWDRLILDESHYAKNPTTERTKAVYGKAVTEINGFIDHANAAWCLTGTPVPNAPNDLWPMMRATCPERLTTKWGPHDVTFYDDFLARYCVVRKKKLSPWKKIDVVVAGRNEGELAARLDGFMLRRTQQDIGITEPTYDTLPLYFTEAQRRRLEAEIDATAVRRAAIDGDEGELEKHLGPTRRLTGAAKARSVCDFVREEFDCGLDKIVLMYWHREVGDLLAQELAKYGVIRLDGSTSNAKRAVAEHAFKTDKGLRVFLGQIQAAGEAIDLSAAAELIFVEASFTPKDMKQAALRITNLTQTRQPRVRVAVLEGSIDEAVQEVLLRKWSSIRKVLE